MIFCASMMCGSYDDLKHEVLSLDEAGIDMFHIDVMDGNFVPNFAMGRQDVRTIRRHTSKMMDVHLMVSNPKSYLPILSEEGADIVYLHPEADNRIVESLMYLKEKGIAPGIAVSPQIAFSSVQEILPFAEYVLLMTVMPGFAGQSFLQQLRPKIEKFIEKRQSYPYQLLLDGAVSPEIVKEYAVKGVDGFVLGTSSLFVAGKEYASILKNLRESATDES